MSAMADNGPERPLVFGLTPYRRLVTSIAGIDRGAAAVDRFPNRELHARVAAPACGRDCIIVGSISPPEARIGELTLLADTLRRGDARSVTAVVPYLAYARQDRADAGESLGLAWAGALLGAAGIDAVVTVDVHSRAAPELVGMPVTSLPATAALAAALTPEWTSADVTFVAPDEGARERCQALADAVAGPRPIAVVGKHRSATGVVHTHLTGTVGPRVVLVDDILDTGATLISCCRWLAREGVEDIAVVVTHGVLTGDAWRELPSIGVRRLWMTDTVAGAGRRAASAGIVPIAPVLAPVLRAHGAPGASMPIRDATPSPGTGDLTVLARRPGRFPGESRVVVGIDGARAQGLWFDGRPAAGLRAWVDLDQADAGVLGPIARALGPGASIMVGYGGDETERALRRRVPPAATPLGAALLRAGCRWLKDWHFAEGGREGHTKLQGKLPRDDAQRRRQERVLRAELKAFLAGTDAPEADRDRARESIATLGAADA